MKNKTRQEKINLTMFILAIIITCIFMFVFIQQKNGWHEDEIFSYGSSNYKYDNLFLRFDTKDSLNRIIDEEVVGDNIFETIKNGINALLHTDEIQEKLNERIQNEKPIWKTPEQAKEYVTVGSDEILSYWSVYYNQSRDVHPPLFYMLVHLVSSLCVNTFSKYIIFFINLLFYIASCFIIRKIMKIFNRDNLSGITVLLYGLSMGGISVVMFQRMYMMLTFFILSYLYLNIKICKNNYEIDKKTKRYLVTTIILGFLTQYYFCIYVAFIAIIQAIIMITKKNWNCLKRYIWCHVKAAIIGIVIFPASIYHIFFSYRGVAGGVVDTSYLERLNEYLKLVFYSFSIPDLLGYILIGIMAILLITKLITSKRKNIILIICLPIILFTLTITKIAPYINIRYISPTLSVISISVVLIIHSIIRDILKISKEKKDNIALAVISAITICISTYGLVNSQPQFLYTNYTDRLELAEENKELKLVYVGEVYFNHIQDIEEFMTYKNSLIMSVNELEILKDNEGLKNEGEYILNIKCWLSDFDNILKNVLEYTNATDCELLLDDGQSRVYKVYKEVK